MDTTMEITIMNKDAILSKGCRQMLTFEDENLIPCSMKEDEEGYTLCFNLRGMKSVQELLKENEAEKLRFLMNCEKLASLYKKYEFSLDFSNLYYDINLMPKILMRDRQQNFEASLTEQFKALISAVLAPKHSYEDYLKGGSDLYRKTKKLQKYVSFESITEICEKLQEDYLKENEINHKKKVLVKKSEIIRYRIEIPVFTIITVASLVLAGYLFFMEKRFDDSVIAAYEAYLSEDYFGVQNSLVNVDVERLDVSGKFILAKAYVVSESLTNEQKENVLTSISLKTEETVLNYWIFTGRLEFEKAIEQAQRLGDSDLLMYAYIKYRAYVTDDLSMNGEEKTELINELDSSIEELEKQMNMDREKIQ